MWAGRFFRQRRQPPEPQLSADGFFIREPSTDEVDPVMGAVESEVETLLDRIEAEALAIFERHDLPSTTGFYRRGPGGDWQFLGARLAPSAKWDLVLGAPPEAGWRYVRLGDIGRCEQPHNPEVMSAVRLLNALDAARTRFGGAAGGLDPVAADAFMAGMNLVLALSDVGRVSGRKLLPLPGAEALEADSPLFRRTMSEERQWHWRQWQAEADAIWALRPDLSRRAVALRVRRNLKLAASVHSIRRRISRVVAS